MSEIPAPYRTPHGLDAGLRMQVLATINPDGSPHLTELPFYLDDEDRILLPTPHARIITGDEATRLNQLNRERLLTEAGMATMGLLLAAFEDTTIEITPERWIAWNDDAVIDTVDSLGGDIEAHPPSTWWKDLSAEG